MEDDRRVKRDEGRWMMDRGIKQLSGTGLGGFNDAETQGGS